MAGTGGTENGTSCTSAADCCSLSCSGGECQGDGSICSPVDSPCAADSECCSNDCQGTCQPLGEACSPLGEVCDKEGFDAGCCSKSCENLGTSDDPDLRCARSSACGARGDICGEGSDCCSGVCLDGRCPTQSQVGGQLFAGEPCEKDSDCASYACAPSRPGAPKTCQFLGGCLRRRHLRRRNRNLHRPRSRLHRRRRLLQRNLRERDLPNGREVGHALSPGASVKRLTGASVARAGLEDARRHNVTRLIIGKPTHSRMRDRLRGSIDLSRRDVSRSGRELHLTPIEYKPLVLPAKNAGKVLTHRQIVKEVWGPAYANETHYVRVHMVELRKKVEVDASRPRPLVTEPGVGYRSRDRGENFDGRSDFRRGQRRLKHQSGPRSIA